MRIRLSSTVGIVTVCLLLLVCGGLSLATERASADPRAAAGVGSNAYSVDDLHATNSVSIGALNTSVALNVVRDGLPVTGGWHYLARFQPLAGGRGVTIGYDANGATGVISSLGAGSNLAFWTADGGAWAERMRIASNGNVGVGIVPAASHKLHVAGNGHFDGTLTANNIAAHFQDVAEWVPASERLTAGMVVVLDGAAPNTVMASSEPYDTSVAGVVSDRPGLTLGIEKPNMVKVATTGRVKVRVDATSAPIAIGDLLVTGDTPGTAVKSQPVAGGRRRRHQPGTIIGKALEPLDDGRGEILVLLSMQ